MKMIHFDGDSLCVGACAFGVTSKKGLSMLRSWHFMPVSSSESFNTISS